MPPARKTRQSAHCSRPQIPCQSFPYFSQLPLELRMKIWEYNLPMCRFVSIHCGYKSEISLQQSLSSSSSSHSSKSRQKWSKKASPSPSSSSSSPSLSSSSPYPPTTTSSAPTHKSTSTVGLCSSPAPVPVNLHVCHESRLEALRHYAPMFGIARQPGRIYFDPDDDFLYFGPRDGYMAADAQLRTMLVLVDQDELATISRVAINESVFGDAMITTSLPSSSAADRIATNLAVDILHELRMRLPSLRELVIVPRSHKSLVDGASSTLVPLHLPSVDLPDMQCAYSSGTYDDYDQYDGDYDGYGEYEAYESYNGEYVDDYGYDGAVIVYHDSPGIKTSHRQRTKATAADVATAMAETDRLSRQVLEAMRRVCDSDPEWISPRWCILSDPGGSSTSSRSKHGRPKQVSYPSCPSTPLLRSTHLPRR